MIVAEDDGEVVGFASLSPVPRPPRLQLHGRGLGLRALRPAGHGAWARACSSELVTLAAQHGFHTVIARIVGGHEASIALHRARSGSPRSGIEREVGRKFGAGSTSWSCSACL